MAWKTLSLHFKQTYEGGYRYLDKCGEFMAIAEEKLNFLCGDAKPTGAKMEIPEHGVNLVCDATSLALSQELAVETDAYFPTLCKNTAALSQEIFKPKSVIKNGFALKAYWPFPNVQELLVATLKLCGDQQNELGKVLGMVPEQKKLDFTFVSGSKELHVVLQPVTFDRANLSKQNIGHQTNRVEKGRIERRNSFADHITKNFAISHALVMELDLIESEPPAEASLEKNFLELVQKSEHLKKLIGNI